MRWFSVAWLRSYRIRFAVFGVGQVGWRFSFSQAFTFKADAMGIVNDPVQDGVSDGGFANHGVPLGDGELSSDQSGFTLVALFKDFEKVKALLIVEAMGAPIIQDQQLDASELVDQTREAAVEAGQGEVFEQSRHP